MRLLSKLEKNKEFWKLFFISSLFFLLRLPSLFEPHWYGDEGIYQTIGKSINQGSLLYTQIWDNKPPLLYFTYALFNADQFFIKFFSLSIGILTLIAFYFLTTLLFKQIKTRIIVTSLFTLLFGLPTFEGNIANAENFMLLPIIIAGFYIFKNYIDVKRNSPYKNNPFLISGMLLGIAFLFKTVAIFDLLAFSLFIILVSITTPITFKNILKAFYQKQKQLLLLIIGFITPFLVSIFYFFSRGNLADYIQAIFFSTFGYVGIKNVFIIPHGLLIIKVILLMSFVFIIYKKRADISPAFLFVLLWAGFSLFNSFFSQRPYTHYLLVLIPSFCLLVGILIEEVGRKRTAALMVLIAIATISTYTFRQAWSISRTIAYYDNFISFVTNQKSVEEYQSFFDKNTPRDTQVAHYVKNHLPRDASVFYWGNSAQMYIISEKLPPTKYTVSYHMILSNEILKESEKMLSIVKPEYIVILPGMGSFPYPMYNYSHKLTMQEVEIYERIY